MEFEDLVLEGKHVRLEPLSLRHIDGLAAAAAIDPSLYCWSPVPQRKEGVTKYVDTAISWREAGTAVPFATLRTTDEVVLGSTRFFNIEHWPWPETHRLHGRTEPDACEIGYTWLSRPAIRTGANTEAKFLMLRHAFEVWNVLRVCFHSDVRNERSRAAIGRIGGKFEGVLRSHRMSADYTARNSARFSIIAAEWPDVKERLLGLMNRY
ncbi:MAG: GNAT family N-acetyltransferase [Candidatus Kryptoniota bacterium]